MKEGDSDFCYAPEDVKDKWGELYSQISSASIKIERKKWKHFTPEFLDTHSQDLETADVLRAVENRKAVYSAEKIGQMEGHVEIETDMPVTIFQIGDIHSFSMFCNQELWEQHREKVLETPGTYMMFYHNLVDNAIPARYPDNMLKNTMPPDVQFKTMQKWIKELDGEGKVLAAIEGDCHEGWSYQVAGVSASNLLYGYEGRNFPILENGGIMNVGVGEQKYSIGMWHKQGPYHSNFNPEHSLRQNRRLRREGSTDAEVGAHHHRAAASSNYVGSRHDMRPVHFVRVGTYKGVPTVLGEGEDYITDTWAVDRFGTSGEPPAPSIMAWADRHVLDNTLDFDTGLEKHMALRTYALVKEMGLEEQFNDLMK